MISVIASVPSHSRGCNISQDILEMSKSNHSPFGKSTEPDEGSVLLFSRFWLKAARTDYMDEAKRTERVTRMMLSLFLPFDCEKRMREKRFLRIAP